MTLKKEFQNLISSNNSLYIYGCGKIGKIIFSLIEFWGMRSKVKSFLVTDVRQAGGLCLGIPVVCVDDFSDTEGLILISLAEIYYAEVEQKLKILNISNYVNAYKYGFIDVEKDECVQSLALSCLLKKIFSRDNYNPLDIVIRLLAIENICGKNNYGIKLYTIWQNSFFNHFDLKPDVEPSEMCLSRFAALIESVEKNGFYKDSEVVVTNDWYIANGRHRLALAIFHSVEKIKVRQVVSWQPLIATEDLYRKTFSESELALIMDRLNQVKEKYGI